MKGYIVLTPEKIEDIFRDLEDQLLNTDYSFFWEKNYKIKSIIESKKQELLKSIKK